MFIRRLKGKLVCRPLRIKRSSEPHPQPLASLWAWNTTPKSQTSQTYWLLSQRHVLHVTCKYKTNAKMKSSRSWSSLQILFTDFDCRNNHSLKLGLTDTLIPDQSVSRLQAAKWHFAELSAITNYYTCAKQVWFLPKRHYVMFGSLLSQIRLSVVCNVRAPYPGSWNFRQYFFATLYLSHPLTFVQKFTEIVPGEPLRRGVKRKRGSKIERCHVPTFGSNILMSFLSTVAKISARFLRNYQSHSRTKIGCILLRGTLLCS